MRLRGRSVVKAALSNLKPLIFAPPFDAINQTILARNSARPPALEVAL
jgi:hypothetical protein